MTRTLSLFTKPRSTLLMVMAVVTPVLADSGLVVGFGPAGPTSLAYNGVELLAGKAQPQVFASIVA